MKRSLLLSAALLLASSGPAAAATLNPDRWNTLEFSEGGASSMKADQITYSNGSDVENPRRTLNVNTSLFALLPLSEAFTLDLGFGGDWTESDAAGTNSTRATADSAVTYQLGGRHYFEGSHSATWHGSDNPDRWTSLGLNFSGSDTINHSVSNANGNVVSDSGALSTTVNADARIPVNAAWTLLASVGGTQAYSKTEPTPTVVGSKTLTDTIAVNGGFRYYLVGESLIMGDVELNPDKWMVRLSPQQANLAVSHLSRLNRNKRPNPRAPRQAQAPPGRSPRGREWRPGATGARR